MRGLYPLRRGKFSTTRGRLTGSPSKMLVIIENTPCSTKYCDTNVDVCAGAYGNNRLSLEIIETFGGEPQFTLTCNLPNNYLGNDEVYIKDYSENEGAFKFAVEAKIIEPEEKGSVQSGFVVIKRYKMTDYFLALLQKNGIKLKST